jgi:apolipoprotein N-acyltransferase
VKGLGLAVLVGVLGLNMFLVAIVLALAAYIPGWLVALLIGGVLVIAAGILGYASWTRRVKSPLATTRKTLKEDAQWAKERLA